MSAIIKILRTNRYTCTNTTNADHVASDSDTIASVAVIVVSVADLIASGADPAASDAVYVAYGSDVVAYETEATKSNPTFRDYFGSSDYRDSRPLALIIV